MKAIAWGAVLGVLLGQVAQSGGATLGTVPWSILVAQLPYLKLVQTVVLAGMGALVALRRQALGDRPALVRSALSGYLVGFVVALLANAFYYGVLLQQVHLGAESFDQTPSLAGALVDGFALVGLGVGLVLGMVPWELLETRVSAAGPSSEET